jgi:hypothetical protein
MTPEQEHAQVGALLARCRYIECGQEFNEWWATVLVCASGTYCHGEGPTQLAAIRAAVEAAEKGVRE